MAKRCKAETLRFSARLHYCNSFLTTHKAADGASIVFVSWNMTRTNGTHLFPRKDTPHRCFVYRGHMSVIDSIGMYEN